MGWDVPPDALALQMCSQISCRVGQIGGAPELTLPSCVVRPYPETRGAGRPPPGDHQETEESRKTPPARWEQQGTAEANIEDEVSGKQNET